MQCLIDADVLVYELAFSGEYVDDDGEKQIREFEFVAGLLDQKNSLQSALGKNGQLLYLTKRVDFNEASLYIHTKDFNSIINLVTEHLNILDDPVISLKVHVYI